MKLIAHLVAASALTLLAACGKKAEAPPPAPVQTTAPEPAPKAREAEPKPQEPAAQPTPAPAQPTVATPAPAPKAEKPAAQPAAPQKPPVGKAEIEKDLAPTIDHARTVTKSEKSAARSRADKAEQEMMELTGKK